MKQKSFNIDPDFLDRELKRREDADKAIEAAKTNLLDFTKFTMPEYRGNWHHELICKKLDEFVEGKNKRLIIACPPRHGKTELASRRFPAYLLGRNPDCKIIACSYAADLASLINRDVQRIIGSPEYQILFPETRLNSSNVRSTSQENYLRNSDIFEIVDHKGVYRSAGVGGSITGMGGNCLIGDTTIFTNFGSMRLGSLVNGYKYNKWHNNRYRVLSYDHNNERPVWRRIEAARCLRSSRILEITTSCGYKIRVTPEHRIFIHDKGYAEARSLQQGDRIYYCNEPEKQRVPVLRDYSEGTWSTLYEMLPEPPESFSRSKMLTMREGIREEAIRLPQMFEEGIQGCLLFESLLECSSCGEECDKMPDMRNSNTRETCEILFPGMQEDRFRSKNRRGVILSKWRYKPISETHSVPGMWKSLQTDIPLNHLLLKRLCRQSALKEDDRTGEFKLQRRDKLLKAIQRNEASYLKKRSLYMCDMWEEKREGSRYSSTSHKREDKRQFPGESNFDVQDMPCSTPQVSTDTVSTIEELSGDSYTVYDIQVEGTGNFFANQILVHNCLIVDDPFRSRADAESPTIRQKVYEWYSSTFRTRRQKDASILLIATRWHDADLTGKLLELAENNPDADQWEIINLPALSEEQIEEYDQRTGPDQALWPDEFPEVDLLSTKASSTIYEWLSLYQQRPSAISGNLVKAEQFKYCTLEKGILTLEDKTFFLSQCRIFQTCDPAASTKTSADFFALATWALTPHNDIALIDLLKTRLETPDQVQLFKQQYIKWHPITQWVESRGLGISLFQTLIREGLPVRELKADTDKVTRFIPAAARIASGSVYFLDRLPGLRDFEEELLTFPNGAHDDCVDCLSYSVQVVIENPFITDTYETYYIGEGIDDGMRI